VPARDFNLKAYAINLIELIQPGWVLNPGPVGHCNQEVRTLTLTIAPPGQAVVEIQNRFNATVQAYSIS